MRSTVYFATNRQPNGPADDWKSYQAKIISPPSPDAITYGTAFIDRTNLTADKTGAILSIHDIHKGGFSQPALDDLTAPGRNLLVFIHGFANSFENALTRAAFNREWFADSRQPAADTTVLTFCWPSIGKVLSQPTLTANYFTDQLVAGQSGVHLMRFFANLEPIVTAARRNGRRVFLLAHSMGNWVLQAAVESWFAHGNGAVTLFDEALLCAPDERYDGFNLPPAGRLTALGQLAGRISIYFSINDAVLQLSMLINLGMRRLGQNGPKDRWNKQRFPDARYRMVDCAPLNDYGAGFGDTHQYYRRSPTLRKDIARVMVGL